MSKKNGNSDFLKRLERARKLYKNKDFEAASTLYHQLIDLAEKNNEDPLELWVELAWSYYYLKRFESTIICLKQVVKYADKYEKMADVYRLMGYSHQLLGRTQKAIIAHSEALNITPESVSERKIIVYDIGQIHFQRGEYPLAKEFFEEARPLFEYDDDNESLAKLYYSLGFSNYYLNNYQEALILFEDMESIADEDGTKSLSLYGQSFIDLNFGQYEALIKKVNLILEMDPDFADKETLAYFMCRSYKALQDRVRFDMFFKELKEKFSEGKYSEFYEDLENW